MKKIKKMLNDFFEYEGAVFRPPREWDSLIIQATVGCSRNSCLFCVMYKKKRFRVRSFEEIKSDIARIPAAYRESVKKIFIADGNALCMNTDGLIEMSGYFKETFPALRHLSAYANPLDLLEKTDGELKAIRASGIKNLYVGIESGSDEVLKLVKKEGSYVQARLALNRAHAAGFVVSATILLGVGGKLYSMEHARRSAELMNETSPKFIKTLTTSIYEGSGLIPLIRSEKFEVLTDRETVDEHYEFIKRIDANHVIYRSTHASNMLSLEGALSKDKKKLLETLAKFKDENDSNPSFNLLKAGGRYEF